MNKTFSNLSMSVFNKIKELDTESFRRDTGISPKQFQFLLDETQKFSETQKLENPLRKRGRKPSLSPEDRILLTLYYLRDYSTFFNLGKQFSISESYTSKVFHQVSSVLWNTLSLKNRKQLLNEELKTVVVDVTEQPIERPIKNQKQYYSGKKKDIRLKFRSLFVL
jgi:hypothetical protein